MSKVCCFGADVGEVDSRPIAPGPVPDGASDVGVAAIGFERMVCAAGTSADEEEGVRELLGAGLVGVRESADAVVDDLDREGVRSTPPASPADWAAPPCPAPPCWLPTEFRLPPGGLVLLGASPGCRCGATEDGVVSSDADVALCFAFFSLDELFPIRRVSLCCSRRLQRSRRRCRDRDDEVVGSGGLTAMQRLGRGCMSSQYRAQRVRACRRA